MLASLRQYYSYVTDPRCKRVGTQAWVYGLCMSVEAIICIKFGQDLFQHTQLSYILVWMAIMMLVAIVCVFLCVEHQKWTRRKRPGKVRQQRRALIALSGFGGGWFLWIPIAFVFIS